MKDTKRNIDEFFQEELGGHTEMPPSSVWENLEKRLDAHKPSPRKPIWWMLSLIAIVFVGGSIAAYYYTHNPNSTDKTSFIQNQPSNLSTASRQNNEEQDNMGNLDSNHDKIEYNTPVQSDHQLLSSGTANIDAEFPNTSANTESNDVHHNKTKSNQGANSYNTSTSKKGAVKAANDSRVDIGSKNNPNDQLDEVDPNATSGNQNTISKTRNKPIKNEAIGRKTDQNKQSLATNKNAQEAQNLASKVKLQNENSLPKKATSSTRLVDELKENTPLLEKPIEKKQVKNTQVKAQERGLSAFPEEDAAELLAEDESSIASPANKKETPLVQKQQLQSKSVKQAEAIAQIRAQNPLAAAAVAENVIDESTDENGKPLQESASGSGGAGGATASPKAKSKKSLNMAIGVKMGYERGTQSITAGKYVGSIFTEVSLGNKLSFIFQPTIKMANASQQIGADNMDTFVNAKGVLNSRYNQYLDTAGKPNGFYDFAYSQQYDSMVQSAVSKKSFVEIEIPFLFRYKVDKNFSVLAGMNFIFGKTLGFEVSERKLSSGSIQDTTLRYFGTTPPSPSGKFLPSGTSGKLDLSANFPPPINPVRFGYTLGLSYVFKERVMIDLLVQQNLSGVSNISNAEVRKIFEQPYVRLSLGYTIFGTSKK